MGYKKIAISALMLLILMALKSSNHFNSILQKTEHSRTPASANNCHESIRSFFKSTKNVLTKFEYFDIPFVSKPETLEEFDYKSYIDHIKLYTDHPPPTTPESFEQKLAYIDSFYIKLFSNNSTIKEQKWFIELSHKNKIKLTKLFSKLDLKRPTSKSEIQEFVTELYMILNNIKNAKQVFSDKDDEWLNSRTAKLLLEQFTAFGLNGAIKRLPAPTKIEINTIWKNKLKQIVNSKKWYYLNYLSIPFNLPKSFPPQINEVLLNKIFMDGALAHRNEIDLIFAKQNIRDGYNKFIAFYNPIMASLVIYFLWENFGEIEQSFNNELEKKRKDKVNVFFSELNVISSSLTDVSTIELNEDELIDELVKASIDNFIKKNNRTPNEKELNEIRKLISGSN
jgi:hypothetical protein